MLFILFCFFNFYLFNYLFFPNTLHFFSTVQQGDPVTHTCIHSFFSHYHASSQVNRYSLPFHRKETHGLGERLGSVEIETNL